MRWVGVLPSGNGVAGGGWRMGDIGQCHSIASPTGVLLCLSLQLHSRWACLYCCITDLSVSVPQSRAGLEGVPQREQQMRKRRRCRCDILARVGAQQRRRRTTRRRRRCASRAAARPSWRGRARSRHVQALAAFLAPVVRVHLQSLALYKLKVRTSIKRKCETGFVCMRVHAFE